MATENLPATTPEAIFKGRFAIFETPDGGFHLSYRPDGEETDKHVQVPGFYVKMAMRQTGGKDGLGKLMKMFGG